MKLLISAVSRETFYFDVFTQETRKKTGVVNVNEEGEEAINTLSRLKKAKQDIRKLFLQISQENKNDKVWPELQEADEEGLVEVESVLCSFCNQSDQDGNDILLCDHKGCFKAYHQKCCDPPELEPDCRDDWFCQQCQCINDW